ncbi:MerR family transcriptional regulator [Microbacterium sp. Root180]|uniref:MerR family transcriptional regulator n=1 Tax=Microbacterium sp. Root180 TaxID=1736483 RepID=UPI002AA29F15|nr:MerR family transcriptional regulator [Microbacterium sp. Root180]
MACFASRRSDTCAQYPTAVARSLEERRREGTDVRIGELAERSGVTERSLRYYEQQGLLAPLRSPAGQRLYTPADVDAVIQIQELFAAGFCSSGIRELLPSLNGARGGSASDLSRRFADAELRLEDERRSIERELSVLDELRRRLGLAPHTRVRAHRRGHDTSTPATSFDHRDRRLR